MHLPSPRSDHASHHADGVGCFAARRALRALRYNAALRGWAPQLSLLGALGGCFAWFALNARDNLTSRGMAVGFGFLDQAARFPVSEHLLSYTPSDQYGWAYVVGLVNTIAIAAPVIGLATALGLAVGLARRSLHPLLSSLVTIYVEIHRNTPLVVQLLFW
jgi:general L-amino acid transport system permease protein